MNSTSDPISTPTPAVLRRFEAEFLRPYRGMILLGLLGLFLQAIILLPIPLLQGWVVDRLIVYCQVSGWPASSESSPTVDAVATPATMMLSRFSVFHTIAAALAATIVLHAARAVMAWRVAAMMGRISQEVVVSLRGALHRKSMRLPMAYFDAQQTGRLMARVTSDVGSILMFIRSGILQLLNDLILSIAIAVLLSWLQWHLALVALVAVPRYAIIQLTFFGTLRRLSDEIRAQVAALYALLSERVSAVRVVRSFAKEEDELDELDARIDRHRALSWENTRAAAAFGALAALISGLGMVFVIAYGIVLVGRGLMTVGELLAIYALVGQLYQPIVRLAQFQATALATYVSVERLTRSSMSPSRYVIAPMPLPSYGRAELSNIAKSPSRIRPRVLACWKASTCGSSRDYAWESWAPAVRESRHCWHSSRDSMTSLRESTQMAGPGVLSFLTAAMSGSSSSPTSGVPSHWCLSKPCCSRERFARTCSIQIRGRPKRRCGKPSALPTSPI